MEKLSIDGRLVGPGEAPYLIAEIGSNHNGDMVLCRKLIDTAKDCGADAVKFQSWSKTSLICRAEYERNVQYADKKKHFGSLEQMVERYQLTPEQHKEVKAYCKGKGITFLSSCFSPEEVDLLCELEVPALKIASMDINNAPLLKYVAGKGKTVILSTGMSTLGEIETAIAILQKNGSGPIGLLHCVSIYPPDYRMINLRNIKTMEKAFDLPVGFSDHTLGTAILCAAVAFGACMIEKHFTLDKNMEGWDHAISADPLELKVISREINNVFLSLGTTVRVVTDAETLKKRSFRRRIVARQAMEAGHVLSEADVDFKRPGTGIHPDELKYIIGRKLAHRIDQDGEIDWSDFV